MVCLKEGRTGPCGFRSQCSESGLRVAAFAGTSRACSRDRSASRDRSFLLARSLCIARAGEIRAADMQLGRPVSCYPLAACERKENDSASVDFLVPSRARARVAQDILSARRNSPRAWQCTSFGPFFHLVQKPCHLPDHFQRASRLCRSCTVFPGVAVPLGCPAAFTPVHPATLLAFHRWRLARLPQAGSGQTARGLRQSRHQ